MQTTQHERHQAELKALLEEEKETRAERKQLKALYNLKQRGDAVAASAMWSSPWLEREGILPPERRESVEASKKQDEKRYRDNAKEKRKKKAEAAQVEEQALDRKQRCLVEGEERLLETSSFEVIPTTEVAEEARLKAMIEKALKKEEHDQRDICDISTHLRQEITPEEMQRHRRIEEQRRSVKEWNANVRKEWQEEMMELKWRIVASEVVRSTRGDEQCHAGTSMEVLRVMQCNREDKALGAAVQGDFESAVTAVQCSRTAGLRWGVLACAAQAAQGCRDAGDMAVRVLDYVASDRTQALTMQYCSIQEWRHKTYEGVWDAQT